MAEGDAKRWLKYGCFGCLGCLGLCVLLIGGALGIAWMRSRSEQTEEQVLTHPAPPAAPGKVVEEPAHESVAGPTSRAAGTVILDLQDAEFHIQPGAAGEPIRVEATYDRTSYELVESTDQAKDGSWIYQVQFHRTRSGSWLIQSLQHLFSSSHPKVRVYLSPDVPIALQTNIERGGVEAEIGGTHLTSATFTVSMGGMELSVSRPLIEPMERLEVKAHMGGGELRSVGNASPRTLIVESSMGGVELDLRGAWRADAEISLKGSMGGTEVRLPTDVHIEGVPGRGIEGEQSGELKRPTLRFTTSSSMGDVEFK